MDNTEEINLFLFDNSEPMLNRREIPSEITFKIKLVTVSRDRFSEFMALIYEQKYKIIENGFEPKYLMLSLKAFEQFIAQSIHDCHTSDVPHRILDLEVIIDPFSLKELQVLCEPQTEWLYRESIRK